VEGTEKGGREKGNGQAKTGRFRAPGVSVHLTFGKKGGGDGLVRGGERGRVEGREKKRGPNDLLRSSIRRGNPKKGDHCTLGQESGGSGGNGKSGQRRTGTLARLWQGKSGQIGGEKGKDGRERKAPIRGDETKSLILWTRSRERGGGAWGSGEQSDNCESKGFLSREKKIMEKRNPAGGQK